MKNLVYALCAFGLIAGSAPSIAATHCRDKSGKFIKCPQKAPVKAKQCRDKSGKFIKCK